MNEIDRILRKKNEPSREEHDQIFDAVFRKLEAAGEVGAKRARWRLPVFAALAFAAAGLALFAVNDEFAPRGGAPEPTLALQCSGTCTRGDRVTITVEAQASHFAAYSTAPSGDTIWYFQNEPLSPGRQTLDRAIALGDEHVPGAYQVHGVFSDRPLTRTEIKAAKSVTRVLTVKP